VLVILLAGVLTRSWVRGCLPPALLGAGGSSRSVRKLPNPETRGGKACVWVFSRWLTFTQIRT
jgi:hypothetical protein